MRGLWPKNDGWFYSDRDDEMSGMQIFNPFGDDDDELKASEVELLTQEQIEERRCDIAWEVDVKIDRYRELS